MHSAKSFYEERKNIEAEEILVAEAKRLEHFYKEKELALNKEGNQYAADANKMCPSGSCA